MADDPSRAEVRCGPLMVERARAAGVTVEAHAFGSALVLTSAALPQAIAYNRAYDVDPREPGALAAIVDHTRRSGRAPLLEVAADAVGDAERGALARLGLARLWDVAVLRADLDGARVPAGRDVIVRDMIVRAAHPDEAERFAALAIRAYGDPPPGVPAPDRAAEMRAWASFCRLGWARCFFAERDGAACGIGIFVRSGVVALVDGAATLPEHRGRGCQGALLAHRLREAWSEGARVAVSRAAAGSPSHRNLERAGMGVHRRMEVWGEPRPSGR
ncbi:MAG: GNAT family N-acetyltransferase [Minicystis sp.]